MAEHVVEQIKQAINRAGSPEAVAFLQRFFKTGPGHYAEGDVFIGARVPQLRAIAKQYKTLELPAIEQLLHSKVHEHRLVALIIMVLQAKRATPHQAKALFDSYIRNTRHINNWDLVDVSSRDVVGGYLLDKPRDVLYKLARSSWLWDRRIAMVSTWQFIRVGDFADTIGIAEVLLRDKHDLIHKAVGWMLREMGKRDEAVLRDFLKQHAHEMPRTMLRYSIERLSPEQKTLYMNQKS